MQCESHCDCDRVCVCVGVWSFAPSDSIGMRREVGRLPLPSPCHRQVHRAASVQDLGHYL